MNKNRKLINAFLVSTMMLSGLALDVSAEAGTVHRFEGKDRVETSILVSDEAYKTADTVVLAGYKGEVDALTGTALASLKKAPLLLVSDQTDHGLAVGKKIQSLKAKNVVILGDTKVVSQQIEDVLKASGLNVSRVAGDDRFDTAIEVAKEIGAKHEHVFLTNDGRSGDLADALTAGPVSGRDQDPILLTSKAGLPSKTIKALSAMDVKRVTIIGGVAAVSDVVKSELEDLGIKVTRVAGDNRWETAEAVANKYFSKSTKVIIANDGRVSYADALVGGYLGAKENAPILLTIPGSLNTPTKNFLGSNASFAYVLGGEKVVSKAAEAEVEEIIDGKVVEIAEVNAVGAKELKVTFNKEIDSTKASIVVKKGNVVTNVDKIEYSEDKMSALITTTSKLTKGDYTVTVTGLSNEALVSTVTVEDEKVAKINVLSETAPLNPVAKTIDSVVYLENETAFVNYEVLNQYGEKMTNQTITWTQSTGGKIDTTTPGQLIIGNTATAGVKFVPSNKVYLTGVHGSTATVVNAEVTIGLAAKVAKAEIKGVYNITKGKLEDLSAGFGNNYVLLFEAKDQYNNKVNITDVSELTLLSDNPLFIAQPAALGTDVTIDDVVYKALTLAPGTQVAKGGTANIKIISNNTGTVANYTITAEAKSAVASFSISAPEKLIAGNEEVEIPFTAVDQYGNAVTKHSDLAGIVTLNPAVGLGFVEQQDGTTKLIYTAPNNTTTNDSIQTITTLIPTNGNYSNVQLTVKPNVKAEAVIGLREDVATKVAAGNKVTFKGEDLLVQDQYGRTLTKTQVNTWLDDSSANNAFVIQSDSAAGSITVSSTAGDTSVDGFTFVETSGQVFTVNATTATGSNTEKLVFSLSTGVTAPTTASVVTASSKSVTFTRVVQSEYASYEVADLGKTYNNADSAELTDSSYNVVPKVYGVTAAGDKVLLPTSKYKITTNGKFDVSTAGVIKDIVSGYDAAAFKDVNRNAKDLTVKVTIMVEDETGAAAATIEKDLVVSNATALADTVTLTDKVVNGSAFVKHTSNAVSASDLTAFVKEIKDQYGVVMTPTADIIISNVAKVDGSTFTVTSGTNASPTVAVTGAKAGDKFTATFKYAGGKTAAINFVVSDN